MEVCKTILHKLEEWREETTSRWIKQVKEVCEDLPWPLDWFCKVVTTFIEVIEVIGYWFVKTWTTVVCYTVTLLLQTAAQVINLALAIPGLGTLLKGFLGGLAWVWSQFVGATDFALGLIGIRPIKNLRVHLVILMRPDRTYTVDATLIGPVLQRFQAIFRQRAGVKVTTTVHHVDVPSVGNALVVDSGAGWIAEDMGDAGMYFQSLIVQMLGEHNVLFTIKVGAPIVVFVVDGVGTTELGCSSGPFADYVCVEGGQLLTPAQPLWTVGTGPGATLAHEIGHACGLLHDPSDVSNLMFGSPNSNGVDRGDNLSPFQRGIIRSSPHVTYI